MRRTPVALAAVIALAACGGSDTRVADTAAGVVTDTSRLAPPVGEAKPAMDSAIAAGKATIDSLQAAGETPASGIAKGIQPAARASANDHSADSARPKVKPTNVP